jgi:hypothetical protein
VEHHLEVIEEGMQVEGVRNKSCPSRLDLGHFKDVVYEGQEVFATAVDDIEAFARLR